jgi:DNA repair exonuclease SbcCD ATPase subunit
MAVSLVIQAQLQSIQNELREMKFAADVDRRNVRSQYDNLVFEVGNAIGKIDAKVEMLAEHLEGRLDSVDGRLDNVDGRLENLAEQLGSRFDNIDTKLNKLLGGA